jgi:hypothetical protein
MFARLCLIDAFFQLPGFIFIPKAQYDSKSNTTRYNCQLLVLTHAPQFWDKIDFIPKLSLIRLPLKHYCKLNFARIHQTATHRLRTALTISLFIEPPSFQAFNLQTLRSLSNDPF